MIPLPPVPPDYQPITAECVMGAAREFDLHEALILAVMVTESGKVGMMRSNTNGTKDFGPMQVNSVWLRTFGDFGVSPQKLAWDGCLNVRVGTWILKKQIITSGGDVWKGISAYHSKTPGLGRNYLEKVYGNLRRLYAEQDLIRKTIVRLNQPGNLEASAWR